MGPPKPFGIDGLRALGKTTAPVAVIEYADFECPYCRKFEDAAMASLKRDYVLTGKVLFLFRHLPLTTVHRKADAAARAAECAGAQGRFWEMHDRLLRADVDLSATSLEEQARALRLDRALFGSCLKGPVPTAIQRDIESARELHVTGTPTFVLATLQNGIATPKDTLSGARPFADLAVKIDAILNARPAGK